MTIAKALVALATSFVYILQNVFNVEVGPFTAERIEQIIVFITPILVYLIPNKKSV